MLAVETNRPFAAGCAAARSSPTAVVVVCRAVDLEQARTRPVHRHAVPADGCHSPRSAAAASPREAVASSPRARVLSQLVQATAGVSWVRASTRRARASPRSREGAFVARLDSAAGDRPQGAPTATEIDAPALPHCRRGSAWTKGSSRPPLVPFDRGPRVWRVATESYAERAGSWAACLAVDAREAEWLAEVPFASDWRAAGRTRLREPAPVVGRFAALNPWQLAVDAILDRLTEVCLILFPKSGRVIRSQFRGSSWGSGLMVVQGWWRG